MPETPAWPVEEWTPKGWTRTVAQNVPLDRLAADVTVAWPWPYTELQAMQIGEMLPENVRQKALEDIVRIGRRAVIELKLRGGYPEKLEKDEIRAKLKGSENPNPKAEIDRLRAAVVEITAAAKGMSEAAWRHVGERASPYSPFRSMVSAMAVLFKLRAKDINSKGAPGASDGRPPSDLLGRVLIDIEDIFDAAHGEKRHGRPAFRLACINPLGFCSARKGFSAKEGFTQDDFKMMESQTRRVRNKT